MKSSASNHTQLVVSASHAMADIRSAIAIMMLFAASISIAWAEDASESSGTDLPPAVTNWPAAEATLVEAVETFYVALTSGDLSAVEAHVRADDQFVLLEGQRGNWGWQDYRDNHLAAEIGDLSKIRIRLSFFRAQIDGSLGYTTFAYEILPKEGPEMDFGRGIATAILILADDGWKLQHLQTS